MLILSAIQADKQKNPPRASVNFKKRGQTVHPPPQPQACKRSKFISPFLARTPSGSETFESELSGFSYTLNVGTNAGRNTSKRAFKNPIGGGTGVTGNGNANGSVGGVEE